MFRVKHVRKNDNVVALSGVNRGKTGKVLDIDNFNGLIQVEGLGVRKKHSKPTKENPKGGILDINAWMPASKFQVCDASGKPQGRAGFSLKGDKKERTFSRQKGKK